jgi:hypothetical protein
MAITYDEFKKHASKVIKSIGALDRHQVLKGIKHFEDGSAVVTDAFRLYLAKNVHDRKDEVLLSPTGRKVKEDYPNVTRLIPSDSPKQELFLDVAELLHAAETVHDVGRLEGKYPAMLFKEDRVSYASLEVKYHYTFETLFDYPILLNAGYVVDALKLLKAAGCTEVKLGFNGSMRPVTLEGSNVLALIVPIRKY